MMSLPDFPLNPDRVVIESPFNLRNESGDTIAGDLRYAEGGTGLPLLILCHGFTAHKDWGPFPYFGRRFAGLGFASAVFNFSHNGMGPGSKRFNELEKFSRNTIGKELEDIRALLRGAEEGGFGEGRIDPSRIGIIGHSRGEELRYSLPRENPASVESRHGRPWPHFTVTLRISVNPGSARDFSP